jgi:Chitin synthase export chaperone
MNLTDTSEAILWPRMYGALTLSEGCSHRFAGIFFVATTYIATDTAFGFTSIFKSTPARDLKSIGLFILLIIWPVIAVLLYFVTMSVIVLRVLGEKKPLCTHILLRINTC